MNNPQHEVVFTTCEHDSTRFDRFGDEVCRNCHHIVAAGAVPPNAGLESASSYRPSGR